MRRWATTSFIVLYLGALGYGLFAHALGFRPHAHPGLYFIVWDMYCGWDTFETERHLIGQGESGAYYDLSPPEEFVPFGSKARHDYDNLGVFAPRFAQRAIEQSTHEPITRVMLVEEVWSRKYNLPEPLWNVCFDEPRNPRSYYYVRGSWNAEGQREVFHVDWSQNLAYQSLSNNPRIQRQISKAQTYRVLDDLPDIGTSTVTPASYELEAKPQ